MAGAFPEVEISLAVVHSDEPADDGPKEVREVGWLCSKSWKFVEAREDVFPVLLCTEKRDGR